MLSEIFANLKRLKKVLRQIARDNRFPDLAFHMNNLNRDCEDCAVGTVQPTHHGRGGRQRQKEM